MSHSKDIRIRVLDYISSGGLIKTACELFKVSRSSVQRWRDRQETVGDVSPSVRVVSGYKVDEVALRNYVAEHPDAYLDEIAAYFGMTAPGIFYALKRLKITRKKRRRIMQKETKVNVKLI